MKTHMIRSLSFGNRTSRSLQRAREAKLIWATPSYPFLVIYCFCFFCFLFSLCFSFWRHIFRKFQLYILWYIFRKLQVSSLPNTLCFVYFETLRTLSDFCWGWWAYSCIYSPCLRKFLWWAYSCVYSHCLWTFLWFCLSMISICLFCVIFCYFN